MPSLVQLTQSAMQAAHRAGVTGSLTITRPAGAVIAPTTGVASGATKSQTVARAVGMQDGMLRSRGGAWTEASAGVFCAAADLAWVPALYDHATWAGRTTVITAITILAPTGTPLAYEFALGPG